MKMKEAVFFIQESACGAASATQDAAFDSAIAVARQGEIGGRYNLFGGRYGKLCEHSALAVARRSSKAVCGAGAIGCGWIT